MYEACEQALTGAAIVRLPATNTYRMPVVALSRIFLPIAVLALLLADLIINNRSIVAKTGGTHFVQTTLTQGRFPGVYYPHPRPSAPGFPPGGPPLTPLPLYCNASTYPSQANTEDVFFQMTAGRICVGRNVSCTHWFHDPEVFHSANGRWIVTTLFSGAPRPTMPWRQLDRYPNMPGTMPALLALRGNADAQNALIRTNITGGEYSFDCDESYYVIDPLNITVLLLHSARGDRIASNLPRTRIWNTRGVKIQDTPAGNPPYINFAQLLPDVNLDGPVPGIPEINRDIGRMPVFRVREVGTSVSLTFTYSNYDAETEHLLDEYVCDIRVAQIPGSLVFSQNIELIPMFDPGTGADLPARRLRRAGVVVDVHATIETSSVTFNSIYVFGVSILFLAGRVTKLIDVPLNVFQHKLARWAVPDPNLPAPSPDISGSDASSNPLREEHDAELTPVAPSGGDVKVEEA